jgi:MFS transporter, DHA2 family, methylenomycin A resistance protein
MSNNMTKHLSLIALCFGFFMVIIDATIINVALPVIAHDMHGSIADLQWVVAGYALTFACLLLSAGSLGDQFGAKTTFIWGLFLFALTSLGCGLAGNFLILTIFRLFQGVAAAMMVPTSLALINASYENLQERAKAIGVWAGVGGIAAASGPILGAFLATVFGWRAIFFINIPVGIIGIFLTLKYVVNAKNSNHIASFDLWGQIFSIISIAALSFGLIEVGRFGWGSGMVIASLIVFTVTFFIFLLIEYHTPSPMFPLKFFKIKTFSTAIAIGMVLNISFYGELFLLPLYFQQIRGYSVMATGFALLPMTGVVAVASYFSGKMTSYTGPRLPMLIGLMVGALGFLSLLMLREHGPAYWALILPLAALGFGIAFTMPAATVATIHSVPTDRAGIASGTLNASRKVGSLLGVAIFGALVSSGQFVSGMHSSLIIASLAFFCGCITVFLTVKK